MRPVTPILDGEGATPATEGRRRVEQAVILAAGRGSRLEAETDGRPKCLLEVGRRTLLAHQLQALHRVGIREVCVVIGYRAEQVQSAVGGSVSVVYNPLWSETNSLFSLWLCRHWVRGSLVVTNSDVLAHPEILRRLVDHPGSAFAYDSSSGEEAEHMKVELRRQRLTAMSKTLAGDRVDGENVGLLRFQRHAACLLFREAAVELSCGGRRAWLAAAVERVARCEPLCGIDVAGRPWIEIDFPEDLARARREIWPRIRGATARDRHRKASYLFEECAPGS